MELTEVQRDLAEMREKLEGYFLREEIRENGERKLVQLDEPGNFAGESFFTLQEVNAPTAAPSLRQQQIRELSQAMGLPEEEVGPLFNASADQLIGVDRATQTRDFTAVTVAELEDNMRRIVEAFQIPPQYIGSPSSAAVLRGSFPEIPVIASRAVPPGQILIASRDGQAARIRFADEPSRIDAWSDYAKYDDRPSFRNEYMQVPFDEEDEDR